MLVQPHISYLHLVMELKHIGGGELSWYSISDKKVLSCKYISAMIQQPNGNTRSHY